MALAPWTPSEANVFKSAWMPAPPPLSEPAMVSATGNWFFFVIIVIIIVIPKRGPIKIAIKIRIKN